MFRLYKVGGYVRDFLMGVESKDIDFAFEFTDIDENIAPLDYYHKMNTLLEEMGYKIFLKTPECFTTRAMFPKGHKNENLVADFVMCRKEVYNDENSRKPQVFMGTLYDDLKRRDITINAIAMDEEDNIIDPFNGVQDITDRVVKFPIDVYTSFNDDPLRILRVLRFSITKGLTIPYSAIDAMNSKEIQDKFVKVVSIERIREELMKMFKHNPTETMLLLTKTFSKDFLENVIFKELWLKPTNEKR